MMQGLGVAPQPEPQREDGAVSPEEQSQYDQFVNNAYTMIYDEKAMPQIIEGLKSGQEGLANTAAMVVSRVEESARQNGVEPSDEMLYQAGVEILESLAETAEAAGVAEFGEKELEGALYRALDIYRGLKGDAVDQDANKQLLGQIQQAEQAGQLGQVLPGLGGQ